jgi:hypothetical protein
VISGAFFDADRAMHEIASHEEEIGGTKRIAGIDVVLESA